MNTIVIYDDSVSKGEVISDIIGDRGFGDVVVKKQRLEDYYKSNIQKLFSNVIWYKVHSYFEFADVLKKIEAVVEDDVRVLHCYSNYVFVDPKIALLTFEKLKYIDDVYTIKMANKIVAAMFPNPEMYARLCKNILHGQNNSTIDYVKNYSKSCEIEGMTDISIMDNFIQCITGNFDSRYFNSLKGNDYTIVKSSTNKKKIKAEYCYYHLLPEDMKYWFVMPFNYQENENSSSYTMERLHMTDLAIKWVHGSINYDEFSELMDRYFKFFSSRHNKSCSEIEYKQISDSLYVDKVIERISTLKQMPEFEKIGVLLDANDECDVDSLVNKYLSLKKRIESNNSYNYELAIGHGDPCFANTLYNKTTKTLKFIDPKGAIDEKDLWTNPYYDIAKLSHSICGRYDFFNNGLFDIKINSSFLYELEIPFDNSEYVRIFRKKVQENGFDYLSVRIYEASLFLSMLPLHIDNPHKVLGFILNARNILKEIENDI